MNLSGLKTYVLAVLVAALGVAETFDWTTVFDSVDPALVTILVGAAIAAVRTYTNKPPLAALRGL